VSILPVSVLQHLWGHRQDERKDRLATEAAGNSGKRGINPYWPERYDLWWAIRSLYQLTYYFEECKSALVTGLGLTAIREDLS